MSELIYVNVFHGQCTQTRGSPSAKNEKGQNFWTRRPGSQPSLSDNHETCYAIHQQCIDVIFRHIKTASWKSLPSVFPCQKFDATIHIRKSKVVVPVDAMSPCRDGRCIAPLILKFGPGRWMTSFTPRSLCPLEKTVVPIDQEAGFASEPVCTIWKNEESHSPGGTRSANLQLVV